VLGVLIVASGVSIRFNGSTRIMHSFGVSSQHGFFSTFIASGVPMEPWPGPKGRVFEYRNLSALDQWNAKHQEAPPYDCVTVRCGS